METTEIIAELRKLLTVGDSPVFCGGTFIPKQLAMEVADRLESLDKRWKRTRLERDQAREMRERAERLLGQAQKELLELRRNTEPVVHARWGFESLDQFAPSCSHCGRQSIMRYPRCPHCGAHMDGEVTK